VKALTLKQPWAWAVVEGGKWIENRSWEPPEALLGETFAIHAGLKTPTQELIEAAVECASEAGSRIQVPGEFELGCIVGVATLDGYVTDHEGDDCNWCVLANGDETAAAALVPLALESPWFFGPVGFLLKDVRRLREPVPCKGALGFWEVSTDVEQVIRARLGRQRSTGRRR
jgi:hypothetical protein